MHFGSRCSILPLPHLNFVGVHLKPSLVFPTGPISQKRASVVSAATLHRCNLSQHCCPIEVPCLDSSGCHTHPKNQPALQTIRTMQCSHTSYRAQPKSAVPPGFDSKLWSAAFRMCRMRKRGSLKYDSLCLSTSEPRERALNEPSYRSHVNICSVDTTILHVHIHRPLLGVGSCHAR